MIPRYTRPAMGALWSDENKYATWIRVETAVCEAWARRGEIPRSVPAALKSKSKVDPRQVDSIEKKVQHDVIAFLTAWAHKTGKVSRYVHRGMTSSDLTDTALGLQIQEAGLLIEKGLDGLVRTVEDLAGRARGLPAVARTHGVHAEPTAFGFKIAVWYAELRRGRRRFAAALKDASVGKISGAVGNYAHVPPSLEAEVMRNLGIGLEEASTQVVQRDRHAALLNAMALIGATLEKISVELRHLQRTEVRETEEPFTRGQKGSSAMPHKKNPVILERITGLARLLRGYAQASMENIALWHERDISHSSTERVILPDAFCALDYMIERMTYVLNGLKLNKDRMRRNLDLTGGLVYSQNVLLKLARHMSREEAYAIVQSHALDAWESGDQLYDLLRRDSRVSKVLTERELISCFDPTPYLAHEEEILRRVGLGGKVRGRGGDRERGGEGA